MKTPSYQSAVQRLTAAALLGLWLVVLFAVGQAPHDSEVSVDGQVWHQHKHILVAGRVYTFVPSPIAVAKHEHADDLGGVGDEHENSQEHPHRHSHEHPNHGMYTAPYIATYASPALCVDAGALIQNAVDYGRAAEGCSDTLFRPPKLSQLVLVA